jgi:hypothetical protein
MVMRTRTPMLRYMYTACLVMANLRAERNGMVGVMVTSTDYSHKPWQQVRESSNEQSTN